MATPNPQVRSSPLDDWFESLAEFGVLAVLVLGPDPMAANDHREVVTVYPESYAPAASVLARSAAYGVAWRSTSSPLVAWEDLSVPRRRDEDKDASWAQAWRDNGAATLVRVDFPTAFGFGFECFMFCEKRFTSGDDAKRIAYTALSVWPSLKNEVIAKRYKISAREFEVLRALADGLTSKEACERVGCAERTIAFHVSNLMEKLCASNRPAVVQRACALGLL